MKRLDKDEIKKAPTSIEVSTNNTLVELIPI